MKSRSASFCKRFFLTKILTPSDLLFFVFSVTSSIFPPFYASIQSKYWHVSLFGYWQLRKIPCFLMAAPAFFLVAFGAQQTWRRVRSKRLFLSVKVGRQVGVAYCHFLCVTLSAFFGARYGHSFQAFISGAFLRQKRFVVWRVRSYDQKVKYRDIVSTPLPY